MNKQSWRNHKRWRLRPPKWLQVASAALILVLIIARLALPWALKNYVNNTLNDIPDYYGNVSDIHVALWRGTYEIIEPQLLKIHGHSREPFFTADKIEIALDWRALLHRRLVTKIFLIHPRLEFIQRESPASSQTSIDGSWQKKVQRLYPFEINRFAIENGLIRYKDQTRNPKIDIFFDGVDLKADNISNATRSAEHLPSDVSANARLMKSGEVKVEAKINLLIQPYVGEFKTSLKGLSLRELNDFAQAYGNFDFKDGTLQVTMEATATQTRIDGYVKTLARHVEVLDWKKDRAEGKSVPHLLWEGLVGAIIDVFKNQRKDQFAARIPISGNRADIKIDKWPVVGSILRNAFIKALTPDFEENMNFKELNRMPAQSRADLQPSH